MSASRNRKRKEAKAKRGEYENSLRRKIRSGELPKYHFVKTKQGESTLERKGVPVIARTKSGRFKQTHKRSWRQQSTLAVLLKEEQK